MGHDGFNENPIVLSCSKQLGENQTRGINRAFACSIPRCLSYQKYIYSLYENLEKKKTGMKGEKLSFKFIDTENTTKYL